MSAPTGASGLSNNRISQSHHTIDNDKDKDKDEDEDDDTSGLLPLGTRGNHRIITFHHG